MVAPTLVVVLSIVALALAVAWRRSVRTAGRLRRAAEVDSDTMRAHADDQSFRAARLEATLDLAPLGVVVVDQTHTVEFANHGAQRYLAGRHGDAVAETQIMACIEATIRDATETTREIELYTPTRRVLGVHAFPLMENETVGGAVAFLEDLTERHRIDAIRKDFVANASHELKTPLGALSVLAETLSDTDDPDSRRRLGERLGVETRRMARLIDDILDLAMVEATGGERVPVSIDAVVEDAVKLVAMLSEESDVPIEITLAGPEAQVSGDHRQLVSAVSNLLENAIKYTVAAGDAHRPPVSIRAVRSEDAVTVVVEDRGIGIAGQHLPRIFERFYRVDRARSRTTGGTGLGLAIVRHVVRNHGGHVEVDSEPGAGTTFRIVLARGSE